MKRIILAIFALLLLNTATQAEAPRKALCPVCATHGETELEKVKAHATHEGQDFYFCSKNCKKAFEKNPTAFIPPELPRPAPAFEIETLDGNVVNLSAYSDKLVILDFWASWCKPCVDMMPSLQKLHDAYADKGLAILGVSIDEGDDRIKKIEKFVKKVGVSYPIFSDARPTPAWHNFKVKAIPALFMIEDGQIVAQWLGNIDHAIIEKEIKKRLSKS